MNAVRRAAGVLAGVAVLLGASCAPSPPDDVSDAVVTMSRGACFGECPVYSVTIHGDGRVEYEGEYWVEVEGRRESSVDPAEVAALVEEFYDAGYLSMKDEYTADVTDLATTTTSLTVGGEAKTVIDYYGAPPALRDLEERIDEVAGTGEWVHGP